MSAHKTKRYCSFKFVFVLLVFVFNRKSNTKILVKQLTDTSISWWNINGIRLSDNWLKETAPVSLTKQTTAPQQCCYRARRPKNSSTTNRTSFMTAVPNRSFISSKSEKGPIPIHSWADWDAPKQKFVYSCAASQIQFHASCVTRKCSQSNCCASLTL